MNHTLALVLFNVPRDNLPGLSFGISRGGGTTRGRDNTARSFNEEDQKALENFCNDMAENLKIDFFGFGDMVNWGMEDRPADHIKMVRRTESLSLDVGKCYQSACDEVLGPNNRVSFCDMGVWSADGFPAAENAAFWVTNSSKNKDHLFSFTLQILVRGEETLRKLFVTVLKFFNSQYGLYPGFHFEMDNGEPIGTCQAAFYDNFGVLIQTNTDTAKTVPASQQTQPVTLGEKKTGSGAHISNVTPTGEMPYGIGLVLLEIKTDAHTKLYCDGMCAVCLEKYVDDKEALPCGHTICKKCIHLVVGETAIGKCPRCRNEFTV